jgi:tetratricopeptide (TPR) repeat protein
MIRWLILTYLSVALLWGQRYRLNIDPETKEGFVLQQIKQERNADKKLEMMLQFVDEFPKDENLPWVLSQLLPAQYERQQNAKALATGEKLLGLNPEDVDAANVCLRIAESLKDQVQIRRYARMAWDAADHALDAPKPAQPEKLAAWQTANEFARNLKTYAEYAVFSLAKDLPPGPQKEEALKWLQEINPRSIYLVTASKSKTAELLQSGDLSRAVMSAKDELAKDPNNMDLLAVLADDAMRRNDAAKVLLYTAKLLDLLNRKPDSLTMAEWQNKRNRFLGPALWMNGTMSALSGNLWQADRSLRAAIPYMRANPQYLSAGLYNLGFVNYQLAQKGEPNRVQEAIRLFTECAQANGPHREQALKNVATIRAEYNIH